MRIRTVLIITGAAAAVLAAGAFAFVQAGAPAGAARAAQGLPRAEPPRDEPAAPSGGSSAAPGAPPSEAPEKPTPTPTPAPEHDDEPDSVAARIAPPEPEKTERSNPDDSNDSGGSDAKVLESGSCEASYYWQGQMTASGESFDPSELTAAHKTLPFDSKVRVTNKNNDESVVVRINDRGPFTSGRCLDLSKAAMEDVGGTSAGVIPVRYEVLSRG